MIGFTLNELSKWIYIKLSSSSVITDKVGKNKTKKIWQIYRGKAPKSATFPYVVFKFAGGNYKNGLGGRRIFSKVSYYITASTDSEFGYSVIQDIVTEIDNLFIKDQLLNDNSIVAGCSSELPIEESEEVGDIVIWTQGNQVEFMVYPVQ